MLIRTSQDGFNHPFPSEITAKAAYQNRRQWLQRSAFTAAAVGGVASLMAPEASAQSAGPVPKPGKLSPLPGKASTVPGATTVEKLTSYDDASTYNNYYEFGTDKSDPVVTAKTLKPRPWTVAVEGLVNKPGTFDLDALLKLSPMEERIYRLRCVEGWSMVVPWVGYSMAELIKQVQPQGSAKFVEFVTLADNKQMPGLNANVLDWPYVEGLRMDEAMHPLTLLAFGMYGEVLPNQNGAPLRLVVPWKYGFKSIKSIIRIDFTEQMPPTSWNQLQPEEYGFYSNVNPDVDHPRWSQRSERRIAGTASKLFAERIATLPFNGYGDQVASLYAGMDLRRWF